MANQVIDIKEFLAMQQSGIPTVDVRTPAEFSYGHIPDALNLPLFDDEERKEIGTTYKQASREKAILQGLKFVGPRLNELAMEGINIAKDKSILVHCWRGGMRSSSVAWLFNLVGIETFTLRKGYKGFRNYVLDSFLPEYKIIVLGGKTGSAKTLFIQELQKRGEQVIDLEGMAFHRGSAFGAIGQNERVTQEQFENDLAMKLRSFDPDKAIWVEDESRHVGRIVIPGSIWDNIRISPVIYLDIPQKARIEYLITQYGDMKDLGNLKQAFFDIKKRLGDESFRDAILALEVNDFPKACKIALDYYDRAYAYGLSKRDPATIHSIGFENLDTEQIVNQLLDQKINSLKM